MGNNKIDNDQILSNIYDNSELKTIGTLDQYKKYIKTIFPNSKIKQIVYTQGKIEDIPGAGGIWLGDSKENVISLTKSTKPETIHKCLINLIHPNTYDSFQHDYMGNLSDFEDKQHPRDYLKNKLLNQGYDGIRIEEDTWNDTTNDYFVTSEQYLVFELKNIYCLGGNKDIIKFKKYITN